MFFGLLIPMALDSGVAGTALPAIFGIGTGLSVMAFALMVSPGISRAQDYMDKIRAAEPYIRKLFGAGLIVYGSYLLLALAM